MAHALAHALNLDVQNTLGKADPRSPPPAVAWQLVAKRFSPEQEWAADKLAYQIYVHAGWDPEQYGNLYVRLGDRYPGPEQNGRAPLWLRQEAGRVPGNDARRTRREWPVADRRTFGELRRRSQSQAAGAGGAAATNPAQAQEAQVFLWAFPNCILPFDLPYQKQAQELLRPRPPIVQPEPN
jgi:hypothetical protein